MNKAMFAVFLLVILFGMIVCIYRTRQKKGVAVEEVIRLLFTACFSIIANIAIMLTNSYMYISVFNSIFFASIDWVMFCFIQYTLVYTERPKLKGNLLKTLAIILLLDTFNMWVNPIFEQATHYKKVMIGQELFLQLEMQPLYMVHLAICYSLFDVSMFLLMKKAMESYHFYRTKYLMIVLIMCFIIAVDAMFVFFGAHIDYSVLSFCLGGMIICVFTFSYVPRRIMGLIFAQLVKQSDEGIILFDIYGHCVYINEAGLRYFTVQEGYEHLEIFAKKWDITEDDRKKPFEKQLVLRLPDQIVYGRLRFEKLVDNRECFCDGYEEAAWFGKKASGSRL